MSLVLYFCFVLFCFGLRCLFVFLGVDQLQNGWFISRKKNYAVKGMN